LPLPHGWNTNSSRASRRSGNLCELRGPEASADEPLGPIEEKVSGGEQDL
jgi:hypothetical protein